MKTILHTLQCTRGGFTVKVTQRYDPKSDWGHYKYVVTNSAGDIVEAAGTSGFPYNGKVEQKDVMGILYDVMFWMKDEDKVLYISENANE